MMHESVRLHSVFCNGFLQISEERHNVPVQQMGNYQEQLKKQPPALRPIDNQPARLHMFGNPFKVNKQVQ